ncbi:MAG: C40 family peptidase [Spirochaetes bacterium]|nr:C40 family peptidase [Spirochaetota bacterium]
MKNKIIIFLFFLLFFEACSGIYNYNREVYNKSEGDSSTSVPERELVIRKTVVENALKAENIKEFRINGKKFNYDCSGFVFYVYEISGINLRNYINFSILNNGVYILYNIGINHFKLNKEIGLPGDIIIFDNTYDRNKNNKWDDEYTHAAILIDYNSKNQIYTFAHIGSSKWKLDYMSLLKKNVYKEENIIYNSYLRRYDSLKEQIYYLAGNLFNVFINIISYYKF